MRTLQKLFPAFLIPAIFLFLGVAFAQAAPQAKTPMSNARQTTKSARTTTRESARKTTLASLGFGKKESLSGSITMVKNAKNLLVVTAPNGVPFDFLVKPNTQIEVSGSATTLADLEAEIHQNATVHFTPEANGDFANSIQVG